MHIFLSKQIKGFVIVMEEFQHVYKSLLLKYDTYNYFQK